jgi:hypothetical protein
MPRYQRASPIRLHRRRGSMPGADGSAGKPPMFATQPSPDWILSQGVPNIMGSVGFGRPSSASLARKRNRGASEADGFVIEVGAEIRVAPTQPWPPASAAPTKRARSPTKSSPSWDCRAGAKFPAPEFEFPARDQIRL